MSRSSLLGESLSSDNLANNVSSDAHHGRSPVVELSVLLAHCERRGRGGDGGGGGGGGGMVELSKWGVAVELDGNGRGQKKKMWKFFRQKAKCGSKVRKQAASERIAAAHNKGRKEQLTFLLGLPRPVIPLAKANPVVAVKLASRPPR